MEFLNIFTGRHQRKNSSSSQFSLFKYMQVQAKSGKQEKHQSITNLLVYRTLNTLRVHCFLLFTPQEHKTLVLSPFTHQQVMSNTESLGLGHDSHKNTPGALLLLSFQYTRYRMFFCIVYNFPH